MLNQYIQYPYIVFPFGLAKPALIIAIIYVFVLAFFILRGAVTKRLKLTLQSISKMKRGEKNNFILSVTGFVVMLALCIILPFFLEERGAIIGISKIYLRYELLVFIATLIFLCSSCLNKSNRYTQIIVSNKVFNVLIWVSLSTGLLTGEIDYTFWQNIIVIVCGGILSTLFLIIDIEAIQTVTDKAKQFDLISYAPAKSADDLFPQHRMQAEDVANIIKNSSCEPFSVCVSGEWGVGKTSVIHGIVDILNKEGSYDFIHINALELDNKQAMIHYLFSQIKEKLKSRGAYVGIDSEFKDFISSSAGTLTSSSIGDFIHIKFFQENEDYRFQKRKLEKLLERTFGSGKLIVIVDDIERCDKELAREYLFLIKEVATMQNCVSIFVTDYNMLNKIVYTEDNAQQEDDSTDFLSKFFNYRIDLRNERLEDVFKFYDNFLKSDEASFQIIYEFVCMSPATWCQKVISGINSKLEEEKSNKNKYWADKKREEEFDRRINVLEERLNLFNSLINNSRNVVKFYNVLRNNILICNDQLWSTGDKTDVKKYIDSRNIGQVLYVLSFAEIFLPFEHQRLIEKGARYIEHPLYGSNETVSDERALLIEITEGIVYGEYSEYEKLDGYIIQDIRKFIETFLNRKNDLSQLINSFSSHEEKWMAAIRESNTLEMKAHWIEMVLMILQKNPYLNSQITNKERIEIFTKLLDFAEQQVEKTEWTSDNLFSIFESDLKTDRYFSIGTGMITTFWKHLCKSTVYKKPCEKFVKEIKIFPYHYTYDRMGHIYRLAHYLIPLENGSATTENLHESTLNINRNFKENISCFLDKLALCIPNYSLTSKDWIEKYKELSDKIVKYLKEYGLSEYPDVKCEIELMVDSIEEFSSLDNIISWVEDVSAMPNAISSGACPTDIEQAIKYFEDILQNDINRDIDKQFSDFFLGLRDAQDLVISKQQIDRLHKLVTNFAKQSGRSSLPYRRLLMKLSLDQTQTNNVEEEQ